ncbi:hypothetical protein YC2023_000085 [Brassica napus]
MYRRQSRSKVAQVHDTGTVRKLVGTRPKLGLTQGLYAIVLTNFTMEAAAPVKQNHSTPYCICFDAGMYQTIRSTPPYYVQRKNSHIMVTVREYSFNLMFILMISNSNGGGRVDICDSQLASFKLETEKRFNDEEEEGSRKRKRKVKENRGSGLSFDDGKINGVRLIAEAPELEMTDDRLID